MYVPSFSCCCCHVGSNLEALAWLSSACQFPVTAMQIRIILLTGKIMELDVDRTSTVDEVLCEILDRMYTHEVLPFSHVHEFRLVAKVGTMCETILKCCHTMAFYNTRAGNVFNLIYLPTRPFLFNLFPAIPFSESLPESRTRTADEPHEGSRSRSRSRRRP